MSFGFDGISINFGAISRRFATRRFTQMKQISQIYFGFRFGFGFGFGFRFRFR
jgi:hypothetical protein